MIALAMRRHPNNVVPLRRPRNPWPKSRSWTRAQDYGARGQRSVMPLMVMLPLAAFTAVFLWDGPPQAAGVPATTTETRAPLPRGWDTTPGTLDAQQPETRALGAQQPESGALVPTGERFAPGGADREAARFARCGGGNRDTCVIDGDTFRYRGEKIRIADINTPEVGKPGCAHEAALGDRATDRLTALLNQGSFTLEPIDRDRDRYGRALRVVTRNGASLGAVLVDEGLAEEWQGYRRDWC